MQRFALVSLALMMLSASASASLCANGVGLDTYISNYSGFANACLIGDKLFYNFDFTSSTNPPGDEPFASDISVLPDPGDGITDPGIVFSGGGFLVFPGSILDATITYSVATVYGQASISGYSLTIAGSHIRAPLNLGSGSVTESLSMPVVAPLVTTVVGGGGILNDQVPFPSMVSSTDVTTQIHLQSPAGSNDIVTVSAIQEHFVENASAVPEPSQAVLIGSGLLLLCMAASRFRA
jgi:hypothetical protein